MSREERYLLNSFSQVLLPCYADNSTQEHSIHGMYMILEEYAQEMEIDRRPCRNSILRGSAYVKELLQGHPDRCHESLRMQPIAFQNLCDKLKDLGLTESRGVPVIKQVAIFIITLSHSHTNRLVAERFQHSTETIYRHIHRVLQVVGLLANEIIVPPDMSQISQNILNRGPRYHPFKNCVGAIDGTHVHAHIDANKVHPYRGRKGFPTQNVMAVCSFDMLFTYIVAGWEGSTNDSRILNECLAREDWRFPRPPQGKYYLVDSGYANQPGFLAPYRGQRYHLPEFQAVQNRIRGKEEMFNFMHSSLRNVIERCFGMLKQRFPILRLMRPYKFPTQVKIVMACCAMHNYIRLLGEPDNIFDGREAQNAGEGDGADDGDNDDDHVEVLQGHHDSQFMQGFRNSIADEIWANRRA